MSQFQGTNTKILLVPLHNKSIIVLFPARPGGAIAGGTKADDTAPKHRSGVAGSC
jgi:hypothetical protein